MEIKVFVSNLTPMDLVSYEQDEHFSYMGGFAEYILVKNYKENVIIKKVIIIFSFFIIKI